MSSKPKAKPKVGSRTNGKPRVVRNTKSSTSYSAPVAMGRVNVTQSPQVSGSAFTGDGVTRVRHREFIADVGSTAALFDIQSFPLNPGLITTFPWLGSTVALGYESYLIKKIRICYETALSTASVGAVMIAIDFDANDTPPTNKQQMMAYHNAVRSPVWTECCYTADTADLQKFGHQRYLRSGNPPANTDIKTYDVGNILVASYNAAAGVLGEIYAEYDIELHTPQFDPFASIISKSARIIPATGVSRLLPFGSESFALTPKTGGLPSGASTLTIAISVPGTYLVNIYFTGTVITDTAPTLALAGGVPNATFIDGGACYHNTAATVGMLELFLQVNDYVNGFVNLDFTPTCATLTTSAVRISAYLGNPASFTVP
jgi:hypothetical protein